MFFFLFVFLGKNAILLDTNAILFEQCEILIHIGGNKMQIVTLYSSTIWELYLATLQVPGVFISKYIGILISKYMNIARRYDLVLLFSVIGYYLGELQKIFSTNSQIYGETRSWISCCVYLLKPTLRKFLLCNCIKTKIQSHLLLITHSESKSLNFLELNFLALKT